MKSCHDIASVISEEALKSIKECYSIPEGYALRAPSPEQRPYQPQPSEISISVDALEAGLCFPLHPTIVECLRWWRFSPSQMVPNSWGYLIAFLGECRGAGIVPSRTLFFACFRLCKSWGGTMDLNALRKKPRMPGGRVLPSLIPRALSRRRKSRTRRLRGSGPRGVKIAVRRHKAHRDERSSRRADREREPEVSAGDASPTYRQPKLMRDLCDMRIQEDDEGYYVLQMADWAPRNSSATMQARWPNLGYCIRRWLRTYTPYRRRSLLSERQSKLCRQLILARQRVDELEADNAKLKSGLDELSGRLDEADKELNELSGTIGLMMAERHVSGTIGLMMAERHVSGSIGLMRVERHVSGTIGLMIAERHVSGTIGLMRAERHVSGTIGLMGDERRVSSSIGLMRVERHILGTIGLMGAERHVSDTIDM
ncbi:hypothetical protein GW17_00052250 [Ensete ventricosum]|nr:hypothetical protein GW17_00052250 [Ensete ventricosum]